MATHSERPWGGATGWHSSANTCEALASIKVSTDVPEASVFRPPRHKNATTATQGGAFRTKPDVAVRLPFFLKAATWPLVSHFLPPRSLTFQDSTLPRYSDTFPNHNRREWEYQLARMTQWPPGNCT